MTWTTIYNESPTSYNYKIQRTTSTTNTFKKTPEHKPRTTLVKDPLPHFKQTSRHLQQRSTSSRLRHYNLTIDTETDILIKNKSTTKTSPDRRSLVKLSLSTYQTVPLRLPRGISSSITLLNFYISHFTPTISYLFPPPSFRNCLGWVIRSTRRHESGYRLNILIDILRDM